MKKRTDHILEKASTPIQRVEKEFSTGGEARLQDNRPVTVQRKKLREAMTGMLTGEKAPIQGYFKDWSSKRTSDRSFIDKKKGTDLHEIEEEGSESDGSVHEISDPSLAEGIETMEDYNTVKHYRGVENYKESKIFNKSRLRTKVKYQEVRVAKYRVTDSNRKFYHGTKKENLDSIRENGLNPRHGYDDVDFTKGGTRRTCRGYTYFSLRPGLARSYAKTFLRNVPAALLTFTMNEGDTFETDPELTSAARTDVLIPRSNIKIVQAGEEVPL